jgi:hypothetical protein
MSSELTERLPHHLKGIIAAFTCELRVGGGELQGLHRGQATRGFLEHGARQHLVLRQFGLRCEREGRLRRLPRNSDLRRQVTEAGLGDKVELGRQLARKSQPPAGKIETLRQHAEAPASHLKGADRDGLRYRATEPDIAAEFCIDTAPADKDAVRRGDGEVDIRIEGGLSLSTRFRILVKRDAGSRGLCRVDMLGAGERLRGDGVGERSLRSDRAAEKADSLAIPFKGVPI